MDYENYEEDNIDDIDTIFDDCVLDDPFEEIEEPIEDDQDEFIQSLLSRLKEELEQEEEEEEEDSVSANDLEIVEDTVSANDLEYTDQDLYNMLLEELHDLNESADIIISQTKQSELDTPLSELKLNDVAMVVVIILLLISMAVALIKSNVFHL